jgi:hypothetical protein
MQDLSWDVPSQLTLNGQTETKNTLARGKEQMDYITLIHPIISISLIIQQEYSIPSHPVCHCLDSLIGPGELLLVVSDLLESQL